MWIILIESQCVFSTMPPRPTLLVKMSVLTSGSSCVYVPSFFRLLNILEGGLVKHLKAKWYMQLHGCNPDTLTPGQMKISLVEAEGAFYFLGVGVALASLVLFLECCRHRCKSQATHTNPLPTSSRTTSPLPDTTSIRCDTTNIRSSVLKEDCYTYTTHCFDDNVWSVNVSNGVSYMDDWEDQYKPNAFISTFEMLDVATPRGTLRGRLASDVSYRRRRWSRASRRSSLPEPDIEAERQRDREDGFGYIRTCHVPHSDADCTDAETGEFSVNFGTFEL